MAQDSIEALLKELQPKPPSAAQVGISAAQGLAPGIQALFSRSRRRGHEQRARQLERTNREKRYGFGMENINRTEGELLRQQEGAPETISARMGSIGAAGGSQEQEAIRQQDLRFRNRMDQLRQQRAELKWGKEYGDEVRSLQESMNDLAMKEAKINALVQTGLEVAKAVAGGAA